jgi:hypothetical protein
MIENAQSESQSGEYRIRGLKPNCKYTIRLANQNGKYSRIIPEKYDLVMGNSDAVEKNFLVFEKFSKCDISVYVNGVASSADSMTVRKMIKNSVKIKLFKINQPDTPIQIQTVQANTIINFSTVPRDPVQQYFIQVELLATTSIQQQATIIDKKEIHFGCDQLFKHLSLNFDLDKHANGNKSGMSIEQLKLTTSFTLPIFLIFAILFYFKSNEFKSLLGFVKSRLDDFLFDLSTKSKQTANNMSHRSNNAAKPVKVQTKSSRNEGASSSESELKTKEKTADKSDANSENDSGVVGDEAVENVFYKKNRVRRAN